MIFHWDSLDFLLRRGYTCSMNSERTQIARRNTSAPTRWIVGHVDLDYRFVLHHGEGKAFQDTDAMRDAGGIVYAYDPNTEANDINIMLGHYDVAISNYVFNVLPYHERVAAWWQLLQSSTRVLVSVRTDVSAPRGRDWEKSGDGWTTARGTFQCIQSAAWWEEWFTAHSPEETSVNVLHDGGHFAIIDVWR